MIERISLIQSHAKELSEGGFHVASSFQIRRRFRQAGSFGPSPLVGGRSLPSPLFGNPGEGLLIDVPLLFTFSAIKLAMGCTYALDAFIREQVDFDIGLSATPVDDVSSKPAVPRSVNAGQA